MVNDWTNRNEVLAAIQESANGGRHSRAETRVMFTEPNWREEGQRRFNGVSLYSWLYDGWSADPSVKFYCFVKPEKEY